MKTLGYDQPLYILPFDHRGSFVTKMFGWYGRLTPAQTAEIAAAKQVIYDGLTTAIAEGAPKNKAGILVDEQFGEKILRDAKAKGFTTACPAEKSGQITRQAAVAEIARRYLQFVEIFEHARSS
jgi:myo-inositol catabolism protein IolC